MEIELITKEDILNIEDNLSRIESTLSRIEKDIAKLNSLQTIKELGLLNSAQIRNRLNLSYSAFYNRLKELAKYGLYSDGRFRMDSVDLEKYIEYKKNN